MEISKRVGKTNKKLLLADQTMDRHNNIFFECLGEIWRDITAVEFLMRCAIAKSDGEIMKLPKPPYIKGKIYSKYPKSFSSPSFNFISKQFSKLYPKLAVPEELVDLRNAMAHGLITEANNSGITQLIKFREMKNETNNKSDLKVEFSISLEIQRIHQIRQSLKEYRGWIIKEIDEGQHSANK